MYLYLLILYLPYRGGKRNEDVHVGSAVSQRFDGLFIEMPTTNELKQHESYIIPTAGLSINIISLLMSLLLGLLCL
jgi:hypothetical protein